MSAEAIDYQQLLKEALLDVPRRALRQVAQEGLPGEHHFFISFRTDHPDVVLAPHLRQQYPQELSIVLQHQFSGLTVDEAAFTVTLRFGGAPQQLTVPFAALTAFVDPAAPFALKLDPAAPSAATDPAASQTQEPAGSDGAPAPGPGQASAAKVFDFDAFKRDR